MEKSQILFLVTLGVFVLATIFFLCGFGGPNWVELSDVDYNAGLWKRCGGDDCETIDLTKDYNAGGFIAVLKSPQRAQHHLNVTSTSYHIIYLF